MSASREQAVIDTFVELADTLASDYDIGDFLQMLVDRCADVLEVETCGVLVESRGGDLRLVAATSETMEELEDTELRFKEGPCLDAYRTAEQVTRENISKEAERWPRIVAKATEMGLAAVYAFPIRLRDDCIGALNLYREVTGAFEENDVRLAQAFADIAAIGILQQRKVADAEDRAHQLQSALDSRVVIEQAKGIIGERHQLTPAEAFQVIRTYSRSHNRKLRDVCEGIVKGDVAVGP
ncbi:MAG TPA: GAF and ANTAR domain-containing protein [Egibacteraceae bacterium]|jgi:GAF domain-containing protein|nr:GAF and ANTAR domain-containing protein [Egibacteraceae bacterium]